MLLYIVCCTGVVRGTMLMFGLHGKVSIQWSHAQPTAVVLKDLRTDAHMFI